MPLASLANLQWYGPCSAAMIVSDTQGVMESQAVREIRPALNVEGVGTVHLFRPYRGRNAALSVEGLGLAQMQGVRSVRAGLEVAVNELSQDDVTGAVLEAKVEGSITLKQALRILLANAAGDATGLDGTSKVYKSAVDSAKTRLAGTVVAGTRTITTLDPD
jgi:hypothetical protein